MSGLFGRFGSFLKLFSVYLCVVSSSNTTSVFLFSSSENQDLIPKETRSGLWCANEQRASKVRYNKVKQMAEIKLILLSTEFRMERRKLSMILRIGSK